MAIVRVRHPGCTHPEPHDKDLGPYPEVKLRFYPRRADIDTALIGTAAARRREHSPLRLWGQP